jgi:hypothetical protein
VKVLTARGVIDAPAIGAVIKVAAISSGIAAIIIGRQEHRAAAWELGQRSGSTLLGDIRRRRACISRSRNPSRACQALTDGGRSFLVNKEFRLDTTPAESHERERREDDERAHCFHIADLLNKNDMTAPEGSV